MRAGVAARQPAAPGGAFWGQPRSSGACARRTALLRSQDGADVGALAEAESQAGAPFAPPPYEGPVGAHHGPPVNAEIDLGWSRYRSDKINPNDFRFYRYGPWRAALPANVDFESIRKQLYYGGPDAAGLVLYGDTLVPNGMRVADRQTLAMTAANGAPCMSAGGCGIGSLDYDYHHFAPLDPQDGSTPQLPFSFH